MDAPPDEPPFFQRSGVGRKNYAVRGHLAGGSGRIGGKPLFTMDLHGSPHDRGYAYGEACRARIARMIEVQFLEEFQGRLTKDELLKHARKYEPFIEDCSPEIAEELRAIAEGAGRSYDEIVMVNGP